jgi:hypothetical protein
MKATPFAGRATQWGTMVGLSASLPGAVQPKEASESCGLS